jgi:hypothetical protein
VLLAILCLPGTAPADGEAEPSWTTLEPGMAFGEFRVEGQRAMIAALRIDPQRFDFVLCSRSQDNLPPRSLGDWGEQYDLAAAINASMYLPDATTSTGYMRQGPHVNNPRLASRFGAFFVAGPRAPDLPQAAILDRETLDWRQRIDQYELVIQNYRMIDADRRILWAPGGPLYSISAVAQDERGNILFLHCREPIEAYTFSRHLLELPLAVRTVMYVEGGSQAGMLIRSTSLKREMFGRHVGDFLVTGNIKALLPNVLGVKAKRPPAAEGQGRPVGGRQ